MSGFENTVRRTPGETPTGPVGVPVSPPPLVGPPPPPVGSSSDSSSDPDPVADPPPAEDGARRRRLRPAGSRTIAVIGAVGGAGATTVAAALVALLPERLGGPVSAGDHIGGGLLVRLPREADGGRARPWSTVAPTITGGTGPAGSPSAIVSDLGPHGLGDATASARLGDVVVLVAPTIPSVVRRAEDARRRIVEQRADDASAVVLVLVETRSVPGRARRAAQRHAVSSTRTIVVPWDAALADGRPLDASALQPATVAAFSELGDALRV